MRIQHFLLSLVAIVVGWGCHSQRQMEANGAIELNFWNGFSGPDGAEMEKLVKKFNLDNQGKIKVRMQIIPWGTYYDKVTLGLAYGGAPQVFVLHVNRFPEFASHGVLNTFDDLIKDSRFPFEDLAPKAWEAAHWEGKVQAIPLDVHPLGLYYNLDLFAKAGITRPPTTYKEFIEDAKKLTIDKDHDGTPDQWGFAFTWLHSNSLCFLNQFGADLLTPDLKQSGLSTPRAKEAMQRMKDIITAGVCPKPEGQDAWLGFQTGKVAMVLEGVYMVKGLESQEGLRFAGAPVPQFGPEKSVWAGTHMLTMPSSLDPKVRRAGWKFIQFLSANSIIWAQGGQVPARKSVVQSPAFQALPVQSEFAKQVEYVHYEPKSIDYNLIATFGDSAFEAILNNSDTIDHALATASRRIDNRLQNK